MITKFEKFNEGINHLLVGPTNEEIWKNYMNGDLKGLLKSIPTSPEDFFNQMKEGCVEMNKDIYGKNGIKLFYQDLKNKYLYVSYKYIWSILENVYGLKYTEIQSLIRSCLIGDIKWKGFTPTISYFTKFFKLEEDTKWKGFTPIRGTL